MAMETSQSSVLAKLGKALDGAVVKHANDETDFGRTGLPPGITNGVARLTACGFGEYKTGKNVGKPFFRAAGVCVEPRSVIFQGREVPTVGGQTSIMEPLCDTKNSKGEATPAAEHLQVILNHLRVLLGEDSNTPPAKRAVGNCKTMADVEALCKKLEQFKPHFRFSTSLRKGGEFIDPLTKVKKQSEDGIWENWHGPKGLENWKPPAAKGVTDGTAAVQTNGSAAHPPKAPVNRLTGAGQAVAAAAPEEEPAGEEQTDADMFQQAEEQQMAAESEVAADEAGAEAEGEAGEGQTFDLSELGVEELITLAVAAGAEDADEATVNLGSAANVRIREIGEELGVTGEQLDNAPSWEEVANLLAAASAPQEPEPPPAPAPKPAAKPKAPAKAAASPVKVNSAWLFKRTDPKTGKPLTDPKTKKERKPVQVLVTAVDAAKGTCTVKQADDPKVVITGVPFAGLIPMG